MFGSEVLDVAVGLVLLFLFLSLICTAVVEVVEAMLKYRAMDLERGIRELLDDRDGTTIARTLFEHPFIYGLYAGEYDPEKLARTYKMADLMGRATTSFRRHMPIMARRVLPSYIPAGNFASALLDVLARGAVSPDTPPSLAAPTMDSLRAGALTLPNVRLQRAVLAVLDGARGDIAQAKANIEAWFNAGMDRVSGWYKRRTQGMLFVIGLGIAGILNIDAVTIARRLNEDETLRKAVVAQAESITSSGTSAEQLAELQSRNLQTLKQNVQGIGYPMGWDPTPQKLCNAGVAGVCAVDWFNATAMIGGWLITALAVMLGAPFWFDLLNKIMVIRATVKPHEKSPEEGSEDRPAAAALLRRPAAAVAPAAVAAPAGAVAAQPVATAAPQIPFEPHRWKDGSEEGRL